MSSRVDNTVTVMGTVIKGPTPHMVASGSKLRTNYQIEIISRSRDKGQTYMPFVISRGNQAQEDLQNIKAGDLVIVNGRIITRYETKMRFFVKDETNTGKLVEKEESELTDEDECFYFEEKRLVTNILAEDVCNISDMLTNMPEDKVKQLVSPKVLERVLTRMAEKKNKKDAEIEDTDSE